MTGAPQPRGTGAAAIEVRDLRFTYRSTARSAIQGMTFSIAPGEIFAMLGPSGAGKSTTQRILIGILQGYDGSAQVLGRPLSSWGREYFERIGVCFEMPNHYRKLTALENLRFFASLYPGATRDADALLEQVGLAADANRRVATYSKGMLTRLSLARALLNRPRVLFLDEPTSGLDPVGARMVKQLVRQCQQDGCTVFLTTHDMALADDLCDRVAFVVDGQIAIIDEPRRLRLARSLQRVRVEHRIDGAAECAEFPLENLAENEAFLQLLRAGAIETIHTREATLEDVFIEVTGRRLQ
ncbi:MAG TPA: ABC transporter ATP-binding protein [Egibacteraceae bacterium]|nr:ABC transporter ATP-binding protein [Egibacteraceae bacterium]